MKAIIIEDETAAVNSLKAVLQQNSVTEIEVIAELESIEGVVQMFIATGYYFHGYSFGGRTGF